MPNLNYCPRCATPLKTKLEGGRDRMACPADQCNFIHFGDFSIGCAGVVTREANGVIEALLVQRGHQPFAGTWQIPGGYAEHDELLTTAVEREVEEESGIIAKVNDVVAFRHSLAGTTGGPSTNVYVIFRLDYQTGEPMADQDEIADAGFFTLAQMESMKGVQGLSKWGIQQALSTPSGSGLSLAETTGQQGWQIFGLGD